MSSECEYTFTYKTIKCYKAFEDYFLEKINSHNKRKTSNSNEGYLISKKYLDYWKNFTNYEDLKNEIIYMDYQTAKKIIKKYRKNNKLKNYQEDASQYSFFSPSSFHSSVNNGDKYALIDKPFWKLICSDEGLEEDGGVKYFIEKGKIIFYFGRLGNVEVYSNDNIIMNGKQLLIKSKSINNIDMNENDKEIEDESEDYELKKLLLLYAYEQEMKKKINNLQYKEKNYKKYYLISKDWIQEYKRYYHYDELSKMINNRNDLSNILNKGYNWAKENINYALSKIQTKKPKDIFPAQLKIENTFLSEGNQITINENYPEVSYWKNFEMINEELKNLFSNSITHGYNIQKASSAKGLISEGKIILDLSNDENNEGNYALEIGVISNKDMIYNDEYIFQYVNEEAKNNHFNYFKNDIYAFQKENLDFDINLKCKLLNDDEEICGTAFKIPL